MKFDLRCVSAASVAEDIRGLTEATYWLFVFDLSVDMAKDLKCNYMTRMVPGGSAQNTARVIQWLLGVKKVVTVLGCVGNDVAGTDLARLGKIPSIQLCVKCVWTK